MSDVTRCPEGFTIDSDIESLFSPANHAQDTGLEELLCADGIAHNPLIVWKEGNVLIDGHRRYRFCKKHGIEFTVEYKSFPSKSEALEWATKDQSYRRNLSDHELAMLLANLNHIIIADGSVPSIAAERAAAATGTTATKVKRSKEYYDALVKLGPDWKGLASMIPGIPVGYFIALADYGTRVEIKRIAEDIFTSSRTRKAGKLREWYKIHKLETDMAVKARKAAVKLELKIIEDGKELAKDYQLEHPDSEPVKDDPNEVGPEVHSVLPPAPPNPWLPVTYPEGMGLTDIQKEQAILDDVELQEAIIDIAKKGAAYQKAIYSLFERIGELKSHRHRRCSKAYRDCVVVLEEVRKDHVKTGSRTRSEETKNGRSIPRQLR